MVRATGMGFIFSSRRERAVGGASVERTGRQARALITDRELLAYSVGIFSGQGSHGRIGACDMYIPESRKRGILCASATGETPDRFQEAMLLSGGKVRSVRTRPDARGSSTIPTRGRPSGPATW